MLLMLRMGRIGQGMAMKLHPVTPPLVPGEEGQQGLPPVESMRGIAPARVQAVVVVVMLLRDLTVCDINRAFLTLRRSPLCVPPAQHHQHHHPHQHIQLLSPILGAANCPPWRTLRQRITHHSPSPRSLLTPRHLTVAPMQQLTMMMLMMLMMRRLLSCERKFKSWLRNAMRWQRGKQI